MGSWIYRLTCTFKLLILMSIVFSTSAHARLYSYPQIRYMNATSEAMAGVTLPLSDETGNALMNNPAALARYQGYRAEPLNMQFQLNSNSAAFLPDTLGNSFSLGGLSGTLNSNAGKPFGVGFSNMTAFSVKGFGIGILLQEFSRAQSDGSTVNYQAISQLVPTLGYGFGLARNVIRVGYSLQYVNQTTGTTTGTSDSSASFLRGLKKGSGLSHNMSVNFAFPFSYLPTFSIVARNLGGLHFSGNSLMPRGSGSTGAPDSEPMVVDLSFDFMVKITGIVKTHYYFEYRDLTRVSGIARFSERLSTGLDLTLSPNFAIRGGMTGIANFSGGISYRGDRSEIGLAYYNEKSPFSSTVWDTRYALQYKIMLNQKAKKDGNDLQQVGNKQ